MSEGFALNAQSVLSRPRFEVFEVDGTSGIIPSFSYAQEPIEVRYEPMRLATPPENELTRDDACIQVKVNLSSLPGVGRLQRAIPVKVHFNRGHVHMNSEELVLFADGETVALALEDLASLFNEQREHYLSISENELSPRAAAIRKNFLTILPFEK